MANTITALAFSGSGVQITNISASGPGFGVAGAHDNTTNYWVDLGTTGNSWVKVNAVTNDVCFTVATNGPGCAGYVMIGNLSNARNVLVPTNFSVFYTGALTANGAFWSLQQPVGTNALIVRFLGMSNTPTSTNILVDISMTGTGTTVSNFATLATGTIVATNGFATKTTGATTAVAATGITNTSTVNAVAYISCTATSSTNFNGAGTAYLTNSSSTFNNQTFILQPGGAIKAASGLSGTLAPL